MSRRYSPYCSWCDKERALCICGHQDDLRREHEEEEQEWLNSHGHQIGEEYDGRIANSDGTYTPVGPRRWQR